MEDQEGKEKGSRTEGERGGAGKQVGEGGGSKRGEQEGEGEQEGGREGATGRGREQEGEQEGKGKHKGDGGGAERENRGRPMYLQNSYQNFMSQGNKTPTITATYICSQVRRLTNNESDHMHTLT